MSVPVRHGGGAPGRRRPVREPWDPFGEPGEFGEFGEGVSRWRERARSWEGAAPPWAERPRLPRVEEEETEDAHVVRAELPGVRREDVVVELEGGELRITGERREEYGTPVVRRRTRRFCHRTEVPDGVDTDAVEAELADGVLRVRLPRAAPARRRGAAPRRRRPAKG